MFVVIAASALHSLFASIWPERIHDAEGTAMARLAIGITDASGQVVGIVGLQVYQFKFDPTYRVS